jgi:hypothetical protein
MRLYNLTDHPDFTSTAIYIRGGKILPGESISATTVDERIKKRKDVAVDVLPNWYVEWKFPKYKAPIKIEEKIIEKTEKIEIKEEKQEKKSTRKK